MAELTAMAAAGGTAVVQAAGTDVWNSARGLTARMLGRGNTVREQAALDRLDLTASELERATEPDAARVRARQEAFWETRFADLIAASDEHARAEAVTQLQELVDLVNRLAATPTVQANGGLVVEGAMTIRAEGGSVAGGVIHGGIHLTNPPLAGQS